MKYTSTNIKRVLIAEIDNGEDLIKELNEIVKKEKIRSGVVFLLGATKKASIVTGSKKISFPPIPMWKIVEDQREILGFGTIFWEEKELKLHIHSSLGRGEKVNLGCLRKEAKVYLIVECIIFEFEIKIEKKFNPQLGINQIKF